tara:strand:+ start:12 stop:488 length:477 start_codon:yes stop_codon:yes gene_type:complete
MSKLDSIIPSVSLWGHFLIIIVCYAFVRSSLGNENSKIDEQQWEGVSYDDPMRDIKIFKYVFSTYLGVATPWMTPVGKYAYAVGIIVLFFRMLFVLNVAKHIYALIAANVPKTSDTNKAHIRSAVDSYLALKTNAELNPLVSREEEFKFLDKIAGGRK